MPVPSPRRQGPSSSSYRFPWTLDTGCVLWMYTPIWISSFWTAPKRSCQLQMTRAIDYLGAEVLEFLDALFSPFDEDISRRVDSIIHNLSGSGAVRQADRVRYA